MNGINGKYMIIPEEPPGPRAEIINNIIGDPELIRICKDLVILINSSFRPDNLGIPNMLLFFFVRRSNSELSITLEQSKNTPRVKQPPYIESDFENLLDFVKYYVRTIVKTDDRTIILSNLQNNITNITNGLTAINNNGNTGSLQYNIPQGGGIMGILHLRDIFDLMKQSNANYIPNETKRYFELMLELYTKIQELLAQNLIQGGKSLRRKNVIKTRRNLKSRNFKKHKKSSRK